MSPAASRTDGAPVLGIETATFCGGVAVARRGEVLGELMHRSPRSHSERLMPAVETLLEPLGMAVEELGAVAVSAGPGSFTGLRVGVAAAKGLAYSLDIPLYGIPTLELLAANAPPGTATVRAILDARRGELFTALYSCGSGSPELVEEPSIVTTEVLADLLLPGTLVIGEPGLSRELLEHAEGVFTAPPHLGYPRAAGTALAGADRLAAGAPSETASLAPIYLRPSDAESGRAARKKTPQ